MHSAVEPGTCYLVKTSEVGQLVAQFNALRAGGVYSPSGLIVSRHHPDRLKQRFSTGDCEYIWLTTNNAEGIVCAAPTAISLVHLKAVDFLKRVPTGVIAIDGAEYLITNNSFETFLRFIHSLHDRLMVSQGILLVALDPKSVAEREFHLLAREAQPLEPA